MGIRRLNFLIKQYAPDAITTKHLKEYKNTIIAIDCSIILYKYVYLATSQFSYINGFINRTKCYLSHNIIPVYVFDGSPPEEKSGTINKRTENKNALLEKINALKLTVEECECKDAKKKLLSEIKKFESQLIYINKYHILECKEVLDAMGIPYVQAPGEGEKMCVYLQKIGAVDHIVTDDTDVFPFGCSSVIKTTLKNNIITEVNKKKILEGFKLSEDEFLDFCILCGCDYTQSIYSVGGITAYNLIKKYKSLEEISAKTKYEITFDIEKIRSIFTDYSNYGEFSRFKLGSLDSSKIDELCLKFNLKKSIFIF
jgi:flap endonuclease-1